MKVLAEEKVRLLAEAKGWTVEYASGFLEGELKRRRGEPAPSYALIGLDQASGGFRAGYFARGAVDASLAVQPSADVYSQVA